MGYTLTFVSLRAERTYNLLIGGGGTAIIGGVSAFETEEENDTDIFKPVRCQSGIFRFNGTGSAGRTAWLAMIPTNALSIPVKLTHTSGGSTVTDWQGYITPQVFQNDYPYNGRSEHEMQVQCPLSVLSTIDIATNGPATVTIASLLNTYIFGQLTGTTISNFYFQGTKSVNTSRLNIKLMWANFIDTDSDGNVKPKYTCYQVLEELCKFFGWTCRMNGTEVFFTMPVDNTAGFTRFTPAQMSNLSQGTYIDRQTLTITDAMFVDTDNNEKVVPGIGNVAVRSDINEIDNLIEIPYEELYDRYNQGIPQSPIIIRSVDYYEHNVYNSIRQPNANGGTLTYENDTVSIECYMENVPGTRADAGNEKRYCRFFVYDDGDVGSDLSSQKIPESKQQFNWRKCIEIFRSYNYGGSASHYQFRITSKQTFILSDGMLFIDFKCHQVSEWISTKLIVSGVERDFPTAIAQLRVGDRYWTGSTWTNNASQTFYLPFNSAGAKTNRTGYIPTGGSIVDVPQYDGYGVKVTGTMRGTIELTIVDVIPFRRVAYEGIGTADINGFLPMLDFEIGFVRGVIEDTKHRGNEFRMRGGDFNEERNVDLIFASDYPYGTGSYVRRMPAGVGYILNNSDEKPAEKIYKIVNSGSDNAEVVPEEELARLISVYGSQTHRVVQLNLNSGLLNTQNGYDPSPRQMSNTSQEISDIGNFFPLAISRNWRDDITTLTLIKV